MSTGVFLCIGESFVPEAAASARELTAAVNRVLSSLGLVEIEDRDEGPHVCEGRTGLDHHGSSWIAKLGQLAGPDKAHCHLLALNPYRLVYVAREFKELHVTEYQERLFGEEVNICLGSSLRLLEDLRAIAPKLGIPLLSDKSLSDDVARKIDNSEPLLENENDHDLIENWRTAWLLMHEAALLSIKHDVPISLAG